MSVLYNSLDFTFSLELKTCFRDLSVFAGQLQRFSNSIKVHLFNISFVLPIDSPGCSREVSLLLAMSKTVLIGSDILHPQQ